MKLETLLYNIIFDISSFSAALRGAVILFPTLGLCWIFSVIAVNHDAVVWKYLFAIFNSIQVYIYILINAT